MANERSFFSLGAEVRRVLGIGQLSRSELRWTPRWSSRLTGAAAHRAHGSCEGSACIAAAAFRWLFIVLATLHVLGQPFLLAELLEPTQHLRHRFAVPRLDPNCHVPIVSFLGEESRVLKPIGRCLATWRPASIGDLVSW